jgi:hypothetical protein
VPDKRLYLLLLVAAVIACAAVGINALALLVVAFAGVSATAGLKTGSFEPFYSGLTRTTAPVTFWMIMALSLVTLAVFAVSLAIRLALHV